MGHLHQDEELYNDGFDEESITARFNGYLEDIIREYSLMASLKGNKNVVYCDDVRQIQHEDGIGWDIYIKMELLTPLVKTLGKTVTENEVINIGIDMCNALVLCKEQNIVHRDIKPQNIFVSKDGVYKLGDFGIAKTAERTTSGTKTGTYKYMAPEVYKSQPYGAAADQYSLGMLHKNWQEIENENQRIDNRMRRDYNETMPRLLGKTSVFVTRYFAV